MKIIIVGCGKVGTTLAEQLNRENHDITLIDCDSEALQSISDSTDVMSVTGNGAVYQVQMEAGIKEADLLIATTNSDELNMLCCLIAKKAGNCHTIARIRNPEYSAEINYIREELNLSLAINPELAAAREIARLLRFPNAIKIELFSKGRIELLKFLIPKESILDRMKVMDVVSRLKSNVLICAVERGDDVVIPDGNFEMRGGDKMSFIAPHADCADFFRKAGIENNTVNSAMFVGGGKLTVYLAKALADTKIKIKIIEQDEERCRILSEILPHAMIIHGDGSDQKLLLEEGICQTEAFASLTGFDEENILLSLYAASQSGAKLITKVNKIAFENVINSLNLGSVIYPKMLTADIILQYVRAMQNSMGSNIETLYKIVADKAEALEFRVRGDSPVLGIPLEKLRTRNNLLVACINRNGRIIMPRGKDTLEAGDTVIIVTTHTGLNDLKDILI
ncbi:Trk system potassium transport protein TrkA [Enterocloster clostridioformis]|uniref:Trk system potassium transporter TrkA n=1 Tax=Enterocloster clostridioformis TaxID=1531 RepID=UPI00080CA89D|nr:Trk system potassium transporter TrkA [Enterocloster clostridioformis]ANU44505.1 Trk system potassium transport protein TrkA [Lachnoclostridium sp. YL32]NDO28136.1 Trk system potassium transporter TrkA [Enterocloster clostridioformis]OXE70588.1 Trk system potassium transport protein TrkA [Enterocloster clostridioformis]QQR00739.1 Trk system potassium transporter TrkA [Enterocloster clostridioformis]